MPLQPTDIAPHRKLSTWQEARHLFFAFRPVALICLTLLVTIPAKSSVQREIPFETSRIFGLMLVRVEVDGKKAVLVVDTGSNHTVMNLGMGDSWPRSLNNITSVYKSSGVTGIAVFGKATLKIGNLTWSNHRIVIADMRELSRMLGQPVDGVLGMDFFGEFELVTMDLKRHLLVLQN
jgi:predicted aspartyl protease